MKTCYIIAAGESGKIEIEKGKNDYVICADAGYLKAIECGITPDLVVGDFDSLGRIPELENIEGHPAEKDETDTFLALTCGMERGYGNFMIFGALGGRLDHTFANLQLLKYLCEKNVSCTLVSERETVTAIKNSSFSFPEGERGTVSVFSLSDESKGVFERGFKYTLENAVLTSSFPLGVSNELTGEGGEIALSSRRSLFAFLTKMQDEVHRFAIGYHHARRSKNTFRTTLTDIDGIGEVRARALLKYFRTIENISNADLAELENAPKMTKDTAIAVYKYYHPQDENETE